MDATNYGADDMGSITAPGGRSNDGADTRRNAILTAVTRCSRTWGRHDYEWRSGGRLDGAAVLMI